MTIAIDSKGKGTLAIRLTGSAAVTNGGLGAYKNPEGVDVIILRTTWYVKTPSAGAANVGIGVAADGTTKATDILNDLAGNGAIAGKVYNGHAMQNIAKTEIAAPAVWSADKYITFTGSADTTGLDAELYVEYVRVPD